MKGLRWISAGVLFVLPHGTVVARAQEVERPGGKDGSPHGRRFFDRSIDFWRTGAEKKEREAPASEPSGQVTLETIWAEPVRMPDGRFAIHVPPKPVLAFLEDPTPESLKGYLEWRKARTEKLRRALELLEGSRVREPAAGSAGPATQSEGSGPRKAAGTTEGTEEGGVKGHSKAPFEITYFHKKG